MKRPSAEAPSSPRQMGDHAAPPRIKAQSRSRALGAFTVRALQDELTERLAQSSVPESHTEARDIIALLCDQPRFWPAMHPEHGVDDDVVTRSRVAVALRCRGAPFAYAVGRSAFRFLLLDVDERVLIPRQETEVLVDLVLQARQGYAGDEVVDIGTGSGAIALALASERAMARVIATDVSTDALDVAKKNAGRCSAILKSPIEFRSGSALWPLGADRVDVVICNPPYIAFDESLRLPASVRDWEPSTALLCGGDGLAVTREIVRQAPYAIREGGLIAFEADSCRIGLVVHMLSARGAFRNVRVHRDLSGRERFVLADRA